MFEHSALETLMRRERYQKNVKELQFKVPFYMMKPSGHMVNQMSMEIFLHIYWIKISFQCYKDYQKS